MLSNVMYSKYITILQLNVLASPGTGGCFGRTVRMGILPLGAGSWNWATRERLWVPLRPGCRNGAGEPVCTCTRVSETHYLYDMYLTASRCSACEMVLCKIQTARYRGSCCLLQCGELFWTPTPPLVAPPLPPSLSSSSSLSSIYCH